MRMELQGGEHDERLAALELRPEYMALALKMPGPVRDLVVFNRDPVTVAVNDVLAGLGLPAVAPHPAAYPGLRSLALLNLLPKSTGPESKVLHSHFALEHTALPSWTDALSRWWPKPMPRTKSSPPIRGSGEEGNILVTLGEP